MGGAWLESRNWFFRREKKKPGPAVCRDAERSRSSLGPQSFLGGYADAPTSLYLLTARPFNPPLARSRDLEALCDWKKEHKKSSFLSVREAHPCLEYFTCFTLFPGASTPLPYIHILSLDPTKSMFGTFISSCIPYQIKCMLLFSV